MDSWGDQTARLATRGPIYDKSSIKSGTSVSLSDLPAHVQIHSESFRVLREFSYILECLEIAIRLNASILHDSGRLITPNSYDKI